MTTPDALEENKIETPPPTPEATATAKPKVKPKPKPKFTGKRKVKKVAPKKAAAPKAAAKSAAPRADLPPTAVIKWIGGENPGREGSGRHERVAKLIKFSGKTVEAYLKAGGPAATLRNSIRLGIAALK
jgi:outer membrane biosynthesis protein TonB